MRVLIELALKYVTSFRCNIAKNGLVFSECKMEKLTEPFSHECAVIVCTIQFASLRTQILEILSYGFPISSCRQKLHCDDTTKHLFKYQEMEDGSNQSSIRSTSQLSCFRRNIFISTCCLLEIVYLSQNYSICLHILCSLISKEHFKICHFRGSGHREQSSSICKSIL